MAPFRSHRVVFVFNGYIVTTFNLYFIETRTFMYKHRHETRYKYPPPQWNAAKPVISRYSHSVPRQKQTPNLMQ